MRPLWDLDFDHWRRSASTTDRVMRCICIWMCRWPGGGWDGAVSIGPGGDGSPRWVYVVVWASEASCVRPGGVSVRVGFTASWALGGAWMSMWTSVAVSAGW